MKINENTSVKELQEVETKVNSLVEKHYGKKLEAPAVTVHLSEEMGEISREIYSQMIGRDKTNKDNLEGEIADCIMLLTRLATLHNIKLWEAIANKISVYEKKWGKIGQ